MPEPINYVKAAFKRQENLIALAALGIAGGLFSNGFFFLAGALEILYLWLVSGNPRFQRVVRSETDQAFEIQGERDREKMVVRLSYEDRTRFNALEAIRKQVQTTWNGRDPVTQSLLQPSIDKLDYLLDTFLRAGLALQGMRAHVTAANRPQLERQAQALEVEIKKAGPSKIREVKQSNLDIIRQRVARLTDLQEDLEVVRTQMETLEHAIRFIADQSVALTDPQEISDQVSRTVTEVAETEKSLKAVEGFLEAQEPSPTPETPPRSMEKQS